MKSIFFAALVSLAASTELYALKDDTKTAIANSVANAKGAATQLATGTPPRSMSAYHWGLLDAESQLSLYRKSEYKRKELEDDIAHHQVDAQIRAEQLTRLNKEVSGALSNLNEIRQK